MERISMPFVANDRKALSRPDPIPFIKISTRSIPLFFAIVLNVSATLEAANGVDFLAPLNPMAPALTLEITFPAGSVKDIFVLLYEEKI